MSRARTIVELDLPATEQLIERAAQHLSVEDAAQLRALLATLVKIVRMVRERGSSIARLLRIFGLATTERTEDVLAAAQAPAPAPALALASTDVSKSTTSDLSPSTTLPELLNEAGSANAVEVPPSSQKQADSAPKKGHGRRKSSDYTKAVTRFVPHSTLTNGCNCPFECGGKLRTQHEPAVAIRIFGQAPLAAERCERERIRCDTCGEVFTAPCPVEFIAQKYGPSAAAMLGVLHYGAGMPFHRMDGLQSALETPVAASTQWEVLRDRAVELKPVHDALLEAAARSMLMHSDDTHARVLSLMGKRRAELMKDGRWPDPQRTGLFTTAVVSRLDDVHMIALFFTGRSHAGENLGELLDLRPGGLSKPTHMSDGLSRNAPTGHEVEAAGCLGHGRRGIVDEVANFPKECAHLLHLIGEVFKNDAEVKKQGMSEEERLLYHQKKSGRLMGKVKQQINRLFREKVVEENSGFGKALLYLRRQWRKLTAFLRVKGAPLSNNLCERILKMAIRYRNNSLFYRSELGAQVGDMYMALIHTATLNDKNPFDYLTAIFTHAGQVALNPEAWLPWTYEATLAQLRG